MSLTKIPVSAPKVSAPQLVFSMTFYRVELLRQLRNPFTLAFTLAMPIAMYLLFGANATYADASSGNGNVSFYVMASMAAFGTATAMTSLCALAASEVRQGWGRQIALTPLTTAGYALTKVLVALTCSGVSSLAVFFVGASTGARADDPWRWIVTFVLVLALGLIFGLFGLGVGLAFNSDTAASLASISITFFSFFGNVFIPLSGALLTIAHFTPMYGYVALVRWPVTDGALIAGGSDSLGLMLLSVIAWTVAFALLVRVGVRRSRRR